MSTFSRALKLGGGGAALGLVTGTVLARSILPWYSTPGNMMKNSQQLVNAPEMVRGTIDAVVQYQLICAAVGLVLFFVGGLVLGRAINRRKETVPPSPTPSRV
jgi:hypothetical protein